MDRIGRWKNYNNLPDLWLCPRYYDRKSRKTPCRISVRAENAFYRPCMHRPWNPVTWPARVEVRRSEVGGAVLKNHFRRILSLANRLDQLSTHIRNHRDVCRQAE